MSNRLSMNQEEFILKGRSIFGEDTYDYSKVVFKNLTTKVIIHCNKHDYDFEQIPKSHLKGHGCKKCGAANRDNSERKEVKKFTFLEFKKTAAKKHAPKKFIYFSSTTLLTGSSKITVKCEHGHESEQIISNHLRGNGCAKCTHEVYRLGLESFIKEANIVHNNKFIYILSEYVNSETPVTIICPQHGPFNQTPKKHLRGAKCHECANYETGLKLRLSTEEVMKRFYAVHGEDKFDYSQFVFTGVDKPSTIICKEHTSFVTTPYNHMNGSGCQKCASTKGERQIIKVLDEMNIKYETEKTFEECKMINYLRFDFYIEHLKILIEFDGEQHYRPVRFGGLSIEDADLAFKKVKKYDKIKNKFAKDSNIKLIRIPYWNFKEIETILKKALQ